jgi:uncharacterized protein YifE (UPF0438 family)
MKELEDGRKVLDKKETIETAKKHGLIPVCMKGSSFMKLAKADKIPENFEKTDWDKFYTHLENKKCFVALMPGSTGYLRIQGNKSL